LSLFWGCAPQHHGHEEPATFLVTSPLRQDTEITEEYVAQVRAIQHIELRALERGYLEGIYVDEGQTVEHGKRMFQIMPLLYQAEVGKAAAEAEIIEIEYQNTAMLADRDIVSPSELALAKAKVDKAQAQLAFNRAEQKLTEIRAPFTGIMGRFNVRKGSLVEEGDLLTTLSDNSTVWVYFNVTERDYLQHASKNAANVAMPVKLRMANGKVFEHAGKVETIEADFNNETGNIAFRATFPNPNGLLRHGQTGNILVSSKIEQAVLIPQKATFEILDRRYVYVVGDDGTVASRQIMVSAELPHLYVIGSGLVPSEKILLDGLRKVREGDRIEVTFEAPEEAMAHLDVPAE